MNLLEVQIGDKDCDGLLDPIVRVGGNHTCGIKEDGKFGMLG